MVRKFSSHSEKSGRLLRTVEAILAPYAGGLEISDRWQIANWDAIRAIVLEAEDGSEGVGEVTKWKAPARSP